MLFVLFTTVKMFTWFILLMYTHQPRRKSTFPILEQHVQKHKCDVIRDENKNSIEIQNDINIIYSLSNIGTSKLEVIHKMCLYL